MNIDYVDTRMDRRNFLRLSGVGIAGVVLLGTAGSRVWAQSGSKLDSEFEAAAEKYGVPKDLLLAIGYANTRWEMPPESSGDYEPGDLHGMGGYGIMQLDQNPKKDTLAQAADLTGSPKEALKTGQAANIAGGAAVLADLAGDTKPEDLDGWYEAVSRFGEGTLYADQVYEVLKDGVSAEVDPGETVTLKPHPDVQTPVVRTAQAAGEYSRSTWYGASSNNYTNANRPGSNRINKIIIHVTQGSWSGSLGWFKNSSSQVSAHYTVRSSDGKIGQSVREEDIAYHCGYWSYNQTSIGIEHEGYIDNSKWLTGTMYQSSARLAAYLCKKYKIPIDRQHIIGHNEVPGCPGPGGGSGCHTDPGRYWNWTKYINLIKYYSRSQASSTAYAQTVDNGTKGRFSASKRWIRSDYSGQRYGKNYRVLKKPGSTPTYAKYKVKTPSKGAYRVYAWWPTVSGYNSRTRFRIKALSGWKTKTVDQRKNGGRWVLLGTYLLTRGDSYRIAVSSRSSGKGFIIADAVKIVKAG